jgi:hypothetical protein
MSISTCDRQKLIAYPVNLCNFLGCVLALLNILNTANLSIAWQSETFSNISTKNLQKKLGF